MKRTLLCLLAMVALVASGTVTSNLLAQQGAVAQPAANPQQQQAAAPLIPVAVVDYMYLMDIHPKLYADMNALMQNQKAASEKLQADRTQLAAMQRELEAMTVGTPDYTKKMEDIRRADSEFKIRAAKMSEEIQMAGLHANYNAFLEIKNMVNVYAERYNIAVVINNMDVARRLPKERSPETMSAEMSQLETTVACHQSAYSITPAIEGWLNNTYKGKYDVVNFDQLKEQRFAKPQQQTSVATGPGGGQPMSPR